MLQQKSAITKAEDLVLIHDINISKPINIKKEMQDYVALQDLEYKMLKWEALRLVDVFNHISNISTQLDIKLIITQDIEPIENLEGHFLNMTSNIIQLSFIKKYFAKRKIELIFYQYIQLVYKFDFNLEQLQQAYYKKLEKNYKRFDR